MSLPRGMGILPKCLSGVANGIIELGRIGVVGVKNGKLGRMQTVSVTVIVIVTVTRRPMRERLIAIYCSILLTKITNHRQRQDTQRRHPKGSQHP